MKIHLRRSRPIPDGERVDAGTRHWFSETYDPGVSAMASGGGLGLGYGTLGSVTVADDHLGTQRCGVPGCGRDRHDPVHAPGSD